MVPKLVHVVTQFNVILDVLTLTLSQNVVNIDIYGHERTQEYFSGGGGMKMKIEARIKKI